MYGKFSNFICQIYLNIFFGKVFFLGFFLKFKIDETKNLKIINNNNNIIIKIL